MQSAVFAMDTRQERELAVKVDDTAVYGPREHIIRLQDTTIIPGWGAVLTPAEARRLAAALTDAALDAELADDDDHDGHVDMVCTACRKPVERAGSAWIHTDPADV